MKSDLSKAYWIEKDMSPTEDNFQKSALNKIINYCNYRDRSTKEIKIKLLDLNYSIEIIDSAISQAIELGIVDNFRFSKSFSRGKNQKNRWGKIKMAKYDVIFQSIVKGWRQESHGLQSFLWWISRSIFSFLNDSLNYGPHFISHPSNKSKLSLSFYRTNLTSISNYYNMRFKFLGYSAFLALTELYRSS